VTRTFVYACQRCSFDVLSGGPVWECPYCGGRLRLIKAHETVDPQEAYVERATDDLIDGLERMLDEGGFSVDR